MKLDFDLQQLRTLTQSMNPDRLLEVGIAIAQRLPSSKRSEFAEFLKQIESASGSNESDAEKSDERRGLDDSSESGDP